MLVSVRDRLLGDTRGLYLPVPYDLVIKDYSKTMNGYYLPDKRRVVLFVLEEDGKLREYNSILETFVHELTHCAQTSKEGYVRCKGVMHDAEFWSMYSENLKIIGR